MGVNGLWEILTNSLIASQSKDSGVVCPAQATTTCFENVDFRDLGGQRLAVDLSVWIVQSQSIAARNRTINKPHLLHTFNRAVGLAKFGVRLVFGKEYGLDISSLIARMQAIDVCLLLFPLSHRWQTSSHQTKAER